MADRLARIFGTEEDRVNCPFYFKIGACRHGDRCSRMHVRPNFSTTVMIPHMYRPPLPEEAIQAVANGRPHVEMPDDTEIYNDFVDDVVEELSKFGRVDELNVCQNLGEVGELCVEVFN